MVTLTAFGPFGPFSASKDTFAPSARVRKPLPLMPVWWTKRSLPPSSGVTKPKPFSSLNHFTVPVAMVFLYPSRDVRALANAEGATEQRLRALGTSLPGSVPGLVDGNVAASGVRNWRRHGR